MMDQFISVFEQSTSSIRVPSQRIGHASDQSLFVNWF